jgi:hypothetical protein
LRRPGRRSPSSRGEHLQTTRRRESLSNRSGAGLVR